MRCLTTDTIFKKIIVVKDNIKLWRNEEDSVASDMDAGYGANNKTLDIYTDETSLVGGGQSHNNMPPYLAINMWQRIE